MKLFKILLVIFIIQLLTTCRSTRTVINKEFIIDTVYVDSTKFITPISDPYDSIYTIAVKYNPSSNQTDNSPLITADGSKIDLKLLNSYKLRWVAISRDLESKISMGDTITIYSDNKKLNGDWIVHDRMNSRYYNKIDLLVPSNDTLDFDSPLPMLIKFKSKK